MKFNTIYFVEYKKYLAFYPTSSKEYNDLREYFLNRLNFDIKKVT